MRVESGAVKWWLKRPNIPPVECVYVLRTERLAKVGWTSNFRTRWRTYISCNPEIEFVAAWPGTKADEKDALWRAESMAPTIGREGKQGRWGLREWFIATPELLQWANSSAVSPRAWWARYGIEDLQELDPMS